MHPLRAANRPGCKNDIIVTYDKVNRKTREGFEYTAADFGKFIHDTIKFRLQTKVHEILVSKSQQRPHEHRIIEKGIIRCPLVGLVSPLGRIVFPVALIDCLFIAKIFTFYHRPITEVAVLQRAEGEHLFPA